MLWHQPRSTPPHLLLASLPQSTGINTEQTTLHFFFFLLLHCLHRKFNVFQPGKNAQILVQGLLFKVPLVQNVLLCHLKAHHLQQKNSCCFLAAQPAQQIAILGHWEAPLLQCSHQTKRGFLQKQYPHDRQGRAVQAKQLCFRSRGELFIFKVLLTSLLFFVAHVLFPSPGAFLGLTDF